MGVEQHLLGAGLCETDGQLSPITAQLYATASLWANHNGPEEANGNEASLLLANQERGVAESNSSGGKLFLDRNTCTLWPAVYSDCFCRATTKDNMYRNKMRVITWTKIDRKEQMS